MKYEMLCEIVGQVKQDNEGVKKYFSPKSDHSLSAFQDTQIKRKISWPRRFIQTGISRRSAFPLEAFWAFMQIMWKIV